MKAVGFFKAGASGAGELRDIELPTPVPGERDLLVRVKAAAVNPVDVKTRNRTPPDHVDPVVLGFDAAGTVEAVGSRVQGFSIGDDVIYAGSLVRPGAYAEYQVVDERIVGPMPRRLTYAEAAALPLASITAWEMLFARLGIVEGEGNAALLVIGGGGGVGSMAIQLTRRVTALTVIATASRAESRAWCERMGAHHVADHTAPLAPQLEALGHPQVRYAFAVVGADRHWAELAQAIAPQGRLGLIDDPDPVDLRLLKSKSISIHWENMFTRSVFATPDMAEQGRLLSRVADLVDRGAVATTLAEELGPFSAAALQAAHDRIVADHRPGKMVFRGY
jgi:zinc-binding alcohol dehydrogenase family protein